MAEVMKKSHAKSIFTRVHISSTYAGELFSSEEPHMDKVPMVVLQVMNLNQEGELMVEIVTKDEYNDQAKIQYNGTK